MRTSKATRREGAGRILSGGLFVSAFACFFASLGELPEHTLHAGLWIVAGAALWLVGEVGR